MLFIRETFLVYKLETFQNCKEVKHIMIIIILSSVIFDQQLKITFRKSSGPPEKIHSPFSLTPHLKWWWWWIVFVVWLTNERHLALFPAGTIVRDPHHHGSPSRAPLHHGATYMKLISFTKELKVTGASPLVFLSFHFYKLTIYLGWWLQIPPRNQFFRLLVIVEHRVGGRHR